MDTKFSAFISYRHASEGRFAADFEVHLKRYARSLFARPRRIFRDEQHVRPGEDLSKAIHNALVGSGHLILLASPDAAQSPWVRKEMDVWCGELGRGDRLIPVVTGGEIFATNDGQAIDWDRTTSLPPNLRDHLTEIPLWVDLRDHADARLRQLGDPRYRAGINGIVARLEGKDPNQLSGAEWRTRRRRMQFASATAAVMAGLLGVSIYNGFALFQANGDLQKSLQSSRSRELAATSRLEGIPASLALSVQAIESDRTTEATRALLEAMAENRSLRRHLVNVGGSVEAMAASADGGTIYFADPQAETPSIRTITIATGALDTIPIPGEGRIWDLAMRGANLLAVTDDAVWTIDTVSKRAEAIYPAGGNSMITQLAVDAGGLLLGDATGKVQRIANDDTISTIFAAFTGAVSALATAPGITAIAATTPDAPLRVWQDGEAEPRIPESADRAINDVDISPDRRWLAGGFEEGYVALWALPELTLSWVEMLDQSVSDVAFSPDSALLAAGTSGGRIVVFDAEAGDREDALVAADGGVWELNWLPDRLVASGSDGWIRIWEPVKPGPLAESLPGAEAFTLANGSLATFARQTGEGLADTRIMRVTVHTTSSTTHDLSAGALMAVRGGTAVMDAPEGLLAFQIVGAGGPPPVRFPESLPAHRPHRAAVSPDGARIAIGWWPDDFQTDEPRVSVWEPATGKVVWMEAPDIAVGAIALSSGGKLAIAGGNGQMAVHDASTGQLLHGGMHTVTAGPIVQFAFAGEDVLYAGGLTGFLKRFDLSLNFSESASSTMPVGSVRDIEVLADGSIVQVDGDAVRWYAANLQYLGPLLTTSDRQIAAWSATEDRVANRLLVTMQGGRAVAIPLDIGAWTAAAIARATPLGETR